MGWPTGGLQKRYAHVLEKSNSFFIFVHVSPMKNLQNTFLVFQTVNMQSFDFPLNSAGQMKSIQDMFLWSTPCFVSLTAVPVRVGHI